TAPGGAPMPRLRPPAMDRAFAAPRRQRARRRRGSRARIRPPIRRCPLPRSLTQTFPELGEAPAQPRLHCRHGPVEAARHPVVIGEQHNLSPFWRQTLKPRIEPSPLLVALLIGRQIVSARGT